MTVLYVIVLVVGTSVVMVFVRVVELKVSVVGLDDCVMTVVGPRSLISERAGTA